MHIRRQLVAAGLLLAVALAAFPGALPLVAPVRAQAPSPTVSTQSSIAANTVYLPLLSGGVTDDLAVTNVQLIQGVTLADSYMVHVAARPALLRVFVSLTGAESLAGVTARLRHYVSGQAQAELQAGPQTIHASTSPGDLTHTLNFKLPAAWLTANSAYVVELDPANALAETNEANNRYPHKGEQSFNVIDVPALDVVIVPVTYKGHTPPLDDLSYLTWMPEKVLPVSEIHYTVRATPYEFAGDLRSATGWGQLLAAVDAIRAAEDPTWNKVYYGLVDSIAADGCGSPCYTGLGYVNSPGRTVYKTAIGFAGFNGSRSAASQTFTHEMGHNFGRRHAPCAGPANVDTAYPYASAAIGQWGYDAGTGALIPPGYRDYMSYCGPEWTSDYTYYGIAQSWGWLNTPFASAATGDPAGSLVIAGHVTADGRLHVDPVFRGTAPPHLLSAAPAHRLELLDAAGRVLAAIPFDLSETILDHVPGDEQAGAAHVDGAVSEGITGSFRVLAEPVPGLAGLRVYHGNELLYERLVTGAAPALAPGSANLTVVPNHALGLTLSSATISAAHYRVRFSPDGGATWHLLALDASTPAVVVPDELLAGATQLLLEVQASDGVRSELQSYLLTLP